MNNKYGQPQGIRWKRAAELRMNLTPAERKLWRFLKEKQTGVQFIPQRPIGPYIVDFCAPEINLVIEVDGGPHFTDEAETFDQVRTDYLESLGWKVIRFLNHDVLNNTDNVLQGILPHLKKQEQDEDPPTTPGTKNGAFR